MPKFVLDPPPDGLRCSLKVDGEGGLYLMINGNEIFFINNSGQLWLAEGLDGYDLLGIQLDSAGCIQLCDDDRQRIAKQWNAEHKPTRGAKK